MARGVRDVFFFTLSSESVAETPELIEGASDAYDEKEHGRREKYSGPSGGWLSLFTSNEETLVEGSDGPRFGHESSVSGAPRVDAGAGDSVRGSDHPARSDLDTRYALNRDDSSSLPRGKISEVFVKRPGELEHVDSRSNQGVRSYTGSEDAEVIRNDSLYHPFNSVLGVVGNHEVWGYDGDQLDAVSRGGVRMPLISTFEPADAQIKAGPLYLEFIYAGAGVLYSDYTGDRKFPSGQEDGWMSILELGMRGSLKISDQFSVTLATRLVYLPGINQIGFALNDGVGLALDLRLSYEFYLGTWNFLLYDYFRVYTPSYFLGMGEQALQRSGRYSFGVNARESRTNNYFDGGFVYFVNTVGIRGKTPFLKEGWDLVLRASHSNFWTGFEIEDPGVRDRFGFRIGANGTSIPFSPYVSYDATSFDRYQSIYNTAYIGGRGRLTDNVEINARMGYLWSVNRKPERQSPLWRLGLTHQISPDTWHSLWGGQTFESSDVTNETALIEYLRYQINHQFSSRLWAYAYAQFGKQEDLVIGTPVTDREVYGGRLNYLLYDATRFSGAVRYEKVSSERLSAIVRRRWIYRASVEQQLYSKTTMKFYYQFENLEGISNFDEHVLSLTLRRYF